jgi:glycosyltransferase involved in cell wall biosynthesis
MIELTALILTFNDRENIGRTLTALSWVKQIVIVDSFSTDETIEIAEAMALNIAIAQRRFDTHARSGTSVWHKSERSGSSRSMRTTNSLAS